MKQRQEKQSKMTEYKEAKIFLPLNGNAAR